MTAPGGDALDRLLMRRALALAARAQGTTWPNPTVGCVIARGHEILAAAATARGGRPHAEAVALEKAGRAAGGATAYVTLEPCAHQGRTPPCADALIAAGIARVVVGWPEDPDPRVRGAGLARLRAAGIAVETGVLADTAGALNEGFFTRVRRGRPFVTLKLATSLDGRIATASGESRWITGEAARNAVQRMRASHDAVMVGSGTLLADDPSLRCRLPGFRDRPTLRLVADGRLRTPAAAQMIRTAVDCPTWVLTRADADRGRLAELADRPGVEVLPLAAAPAGGIDPLAAFRALGERGLTRVLVEGGGRLAASLLDAALVDELAWHRAPILLGAGGVPAIGPLPAAPLGTARRWRRTGARRAGADLLETWRPVRSD